MNCKEMKPQYHLSYSHVSPLSQERMPFRRWLPRLRRCLDPGRRDLLFASAQQINGIAGSPSATTDRLVFKPVS